MKSFILSAAIFLSISVMAKAGETVKCPVLAGKWKCIETQGLDAREAAEQVLEEGEERWVPGFDLKIEQTENEIGQTVFKAGQQNPIVIDGGRGEKSQASCVHEKSINLQSVDPSDLMFTGSSWMPLLKLETHSYKKIDESKMTIIITSSHFTTADEAVRVEKTVSECTKINP